MGGVGCSDPVGGVGCSDPMGGVGCSDPVSVYGTIVDVGGVRVKVFQLILPISLCERCKRGGTCSAKMDGQGAGHNPSKSISEESHTTPSPFLLQTQQTRASHCPAQGVTRRSCTKSTSTG